MQYVGIYDKNGYVAEQIKSMKFWSVRNDFELTEICLLYTSDAADE